MIPKECKRLVGEKRNAFYELPPKRAPKLNTSAPKGPPKKSKTRSRS